MGQSSSTTAALRQLDANLSSGFQNVQMRFDEQSLKLGFLVEHASRRRAEAVFGSSAAADPVSLRTLKELVAYFLPGLQAVEAKPVLHELRIECVSHLGHLYKALACCLSAMGMYVRTRAKPHYDAPAANPVDVHEAAQALGQLHAALLGLGISPEEIAGGLANVNTRMLALDRTLPQHQRWWRGPLQGYYVFFKHLGRLCRETANDLQAWQSALWEPSVHSVQFPAGGDVWFMITAYKTTKTFIYALDLDHRGQLVEGAPAVLEFGETKSDISSRSKAVARAKNIARLGQFVHRLQHRRSSLHIVNHLFIPKLHPSMLPERDLHVDNLTMKTYLFS